jgi:predicted metal-dependent HD superfamily phosphohydrolase
MNNIGSHPQFPNLSIRWNAIFGTSEDSKVVFEVLIQSYSQPHRKYHNLNHIEFMLQNLEKLFPDQKNSRSIHLAIWFHDVVFNPYSRSNEESSQKIFLKYAPRLSVTPKETEDTLKMIESSIRHSALQNTREESCFLDLDLLALGQDREAYFRYSAQIREELRLIPDFIYRNLRTKALQSLFSEGTLFRSDELRHLNKVATENINFEISELNQRKNAIVGFLVVLSLIPFSIFGFSAPSVAGKLVVLVVAVLVCFARIYIRAPSYEINDLGIRRHRSLGRIDKIMWSELIEADIVTTDEGPFVEDVFLVLIGESGECIVPQSSPAFAQILKKLEQLADYQPDAVIYAMLSTQNARFVVWQR